MELRIDDFGSVVMDLQADGIVVAANSDGWMGGWLSRYIRGKGVAQSLNHLTRGRLEKEAKVVAKNNRLNPGKVFVTSAPEPLPFHATVLHAVTVAHPGDRSDLWVVQECLYRLEKEILDRGIRRVVVPLLGTGTGGLSPAAVYPLIKHWATSFAPTVEVFLVTNRSLSDVVSLYSSSN